MTYAHIAVELWFIVSSLIACWVIANAGVMAWTYHQTVRKGAKRSYKNSTRF